MVVKAATAQAICGNRRPQKDWTSTGDAKGHFSSDVCDQPKHSGNEHRDSVTGKTWRA